MIFNQLKVNDDVMYYGKRYTVLNISPPKVSIIRSDGDGECITIRFTELVTDTTFRNEGSVAFVDHPNSMGGNAEIYGNVLDALSEKQRQEVSRRLELIKPLLLFEKAKQNNHRARQEFITQYNEFLLDKKDIEELSQTELLEKITQKYSVLNEYGEKVEKVSVSTLKRYLSAYRKAERELSKFADEGLVSKQGNGYQYRKDNRTIEICHPKKPDLVLDYINVRIGDEYVPIIKQAIEQDYLSLKKKTKKAVFVSIEVRCFKNGLNPPSENTIMKILGRIDPHIQTRLRLGTKASEAFDPVTRGFSNEEAQYPLHMVEIDHTELDLDVLDGKTGHTIGRPWITLGIDVYSRMIWCLYVSFEPPSANVVRKAIEHGIFFKRTKERHGTKNEWDVFGIPSIIYMDNGPEFRNAEVKRMITETLKSHVRYRPVKTPRYGGTIERYFGTLNKQLIHQLDGTRKSNPQDLGEYNPDAEAKLTLEDVKEIITMYITDIYHMIPHKGLPLDADTPVTRYIDGLEKTGFPEYINPTDEEAIHRELLPNILKPYTRDGIRLNNVRYKLNSLSNLIAKQSTKYKVKYDIDDISYIYVLPPNSQNYVRVPAVQPAAEEIEGFNWYTWKQIQGIMREESKWKRAAVPGTERVAEAKAELQKRIQQKYKKGRKVRQQAARMNMPVSIGGVFSPQQSTYKPSIKDRIAAARQAVEDRLLQEENE